ncbi:hypothetical protein [Winogradskya humida]|uniref:Uncharacterized protein n=1 Tax=Winogradskya humida TaxID=113566 RepID=A0ABQ4A4C8_9ACTN|nr:hypothetical protein [Actinoplanes humidus]GIE25684.1 hypothetical protein Ahu01nite_087860 [Actinoplanes humidus]
MKTIEVSDEAHARLTFAADIAKISLSEAVDRAVGVPTDPPVPTAAEPEHAEGDEIAIVVTYRGHEVSGYLDLRTENVRLTAAPKAELIRTYKSPSQAAVATVRALNPGRQHPETNGWRFFYGKDGQLIDRHRRHP